MLRRPFLYLALAAPLMAQVDHASLNGTVTDASQSVVPGAKVEAVSSLTGFRRETFTGSSGTYQIPAVPIGVYTVTISKAGFRAAEFKDVELTVGQPRTIDVQLAVGQVAEAVQVVAAAENFNRTSPEIGGLIEPA